MILIVDQASLRVISNSLGMYKLMENRVYLVEQLIKARAPYRRSAPIYFLSPTEQSVNLLIDDWTRSRKRKEPLYADNVFVYFTNALPDHLFSKIKACKPLVKRLKALGEVNVDFITKQKDAFHLDMNSAKCFTDLYRSSPSPAVVDEIASKLVTVCASLNEYPHIRHKASSRVGTSVANIFNQKFTSFIGKNKNWWYHGDSLHTKRGRSTLLILSRDDDCLSPLVHEFTYQCMVKDILPMDEDKIKVESQNAGDGVVDKEVLLNEKDEVWVQLRGKHIADVLTTLSTRIRDIVNSNTGVALNTKSSKKSLSMNQMAKALKALPEYQELMSKLSQHLQISHQCMDIFKRQGLLDLSDIEQTLATGKDDEGKSPRLSDMVDMVENQLRNTHDPVSRFRLLAIFIQSQTGMKPTDQGRLFTAANLGPKESMALSNLEALGIPLVQPMTTSRVGSVLSGDRIAARKEAVDSGSEYNTTRYACDLKDLLQKMQQNKLSLQEYPSIYPMPEMAPETLTQTGVSSARSKTSKYSKTNKNGVAVNSGKGSRQIVFVAGGVCFSELRAAEELTEAGGPEVVIGGTSFITPGSFVEDIASI